MRELPEVNLKDLSGAVFGAFESAGIMGYE
jgi:hypothetical protein